MKNPSKAKLGEINVTAIGVPHFYKLKELRGYKHPQSLTKRVKGQQKMGDASDTLVSPPHDEERALPSETQYRSMIDNLEQCVFLKDHEFRFVNANKPFCQSLGRSKAEIVGKTDFDFYPRHLAEKYRADDLVVLNEDRRLEAEEQNVAEGKVRTVRVVKTPVKPPEQGSHQRPSHLRVTSSSRMKRQRRRWESNPLPPGCSRLPGRLAPASLVISLDGWIRTSVLRLPKPADETRLSHIQKLQSEPNKKSQASL